MNVIVFWSVGVSALRSDLFMYGEYDTGAVVEFNFKASYFAFFSHSSRFWSAFHILILNSIMNFNTMAFEQ